ncbi:PHA/PHB synthase family protein [Glaciecola sp. 2405UD65-10]|uniref:PHA/PHB synthase family protein n=1 Tax=Glaciecola sp. 2405UD65-10 TaxID=3397244 RepID=UPI003B5C0B30
MENNNTQVLAYIEQYAKIFNSVAQDIIQRASTGNEQSSPLLGDLEKLQKLLAGNTRLDPSKLFEQQMQYMQKQTDLWQRATKAMMGEELNTPASNRKPDKRFAHQDWESNPVFNYIKESYLINVDMITNMVDAVEFEDPKDAEQAKFFTRQYLNSLSPTNFVLTNPEVCEEILKTEGQSILKGMQAYLEDLEQSPLEAFKMRQSDTKSFTLGKNLACTPGKVVYRNELIELLHYTPKTKTCHEVPVLVTPPFINKYYVLDLAEDKSLAGGLLDSGHSVFMISWINPDAELAEKDFFDYMRQGPLEAMDVIKEITGKDKVNLTGFCVGGTLSALSAAYLKAKGDESVNSLTLLTTLLDFSRPGEVANYLSPDMLSMIEQNADIKGVFDGRIMAMSFSLLRENSLFWSFFIDNYLKGKDPAPFDILYWNSDSTNIPASCFKQYLHLTYWENKLCKPGSINIDGVAIDLANIDVPVYFLNTVADHIVLWQSAYEGTKLVGGNTRFVLGGSGHIAGVINPAKGGKYPHWTNNALPSTAQEWFDGATQHQGSWWIDWHKWLKPMSGKRIKPPQPGACENLPPLGDAPGEYVLKVLQ